MLLRQLALLLLNLRAQGRRRDTLKAPSDCSLVKAAKNKPPGPRLRARKPDNLQFALIVFAGLLKGLLELLGTAKGTV